MRRVFGKAIAHRYQFGRAKRNSNRIDLANMTHHMQIQEEIIHMGTWGSTSLRPGARVQSLGNYLTIIVNRMEDLHHIQLDPTRSVRVCSILVSRSTSVSLEEDRQSLMVEPNPDQGSKCGSTVFASEMPRDVILLP